MPSIDHHAPRLVAPSFGHVGALCKSPAASARPPQDAAPGDPTDGPADQPIASETLRFEDGLCVAYDEEFHSGAAPEGAYRCTLHISAASLSMGAVSKDNNWVETR